METDEQGEQNEVSFRDALVSLPILDDDLYLSMQALNIHIVDLYLVDMETDLLREYIEIERTPLEMALVVSALSQLWIFGLYELLRTWRQRCKDIIKFVDDLQLLNNSARKARISEQKKKIKKAVGFGGFEGLYWPNYEKAAKENEFVELIRQKLDQSEKLFKKNRSIASCISQT